MKKIYENRKIVLLTKHSKEAVIKMVLENETGCELILETGFDTDKLGTFSREMKRFGSQLETARIKVNEGMKLAKTDIGIASEGSFGSHPYVPIPWNIEIVLLYDKKENMEICGTFESFETNLGHLKTNDFNSAIKFAEQAGFPTHYLILRPDDEFSQNIIKDICSFEKLKTAFHWCLTKSQSGFVFIETDMRAHANPTRMKNIEKATYDLISKLISLCPKCGSPGFIIKEEIKGLSCEQCGIPTRMTMKYIHRCHKCKHELEQLYPLGKTSSAQYCERCNP